MWYQTIMTITFMVDVPVITDISNPIYHKNQDTSKTLSLLAHGEQKERKILRAMMVAQETRKAKPKWGE